ncbi:MAG TPA: cation diffusion facilitator family transporter [Streptosporangiaceae bacterium]|jgi:cation diffusion facilitator family transporter
MSHGHGHDHEGHGHEGHDEHGRERLWARVTHAIRPHSHDADTDQAVEASAEGMRALRISLIALGVTAIVQAVIVSLSGSVALLGDALHNAADALTAVPLGVAFVLGRRRPSRRYTYGYGRAEDLAGIVIVAVIAVSSAAAAFAAVQRLLYPRPVTHLAAVAVAAALGFAGNELAARYRIRTGRKIGSASLVADGLHARADGFTSLAVLAGAGAVAMGWTWADPVVGLFITVAIIGVGWQSGRQVLRRLMDSVDPELTDTAIATIRTVPGVRGVGDVRLRWIGHRLRAECEILVDPDAPTIAAHKVAVDTEHALIHAIPRLIAATVHTDPYAADHAEHHAVLAGADHSQPG